MLSFDKAKIILYDDKNNETISIKKHKFIEYILEIQEFRCFQGIMVQDNISGSFIYLNSKEFKLLDTDNSILFRKTPNALRVH